MSKNIFNRYSIQHYNLDNYVFADSQIKSDLNDIIRKKMSDMETLIFLSTEGNGGTFLLYSTLKLMINDENEFANIIGDDYSRIYKIPPEEFIEKCKLYTYIVFDNIEVGCSNSLIYDWLRGIFEKLRVLGKKTLVSYTMQNEVDLIIPEFINSSIYKSFYSLRQPSIYPEIVKRCFHEFGFSASEEIVNEIASNEKISIRELQALCLMYYVKNQIGK